MLSCAAVLALAFPADALVLNYKGIESQLSPVAIAVGAVAVFCLLLAIFLIARTRADGYKNFGDKSGLSTSSSDITSSETGSTDRELKSRMERFEKRLEEHKRMLESQRDGAESSSVTDSQSDATGDHGPWMKK
eukprot:gnl/MRDRNA2_/MRDRNA2_59584_c0_seq2.p1 gnl/MRDRNA2_/MRDRNA2_59584_c0~~gnl/MRDRNA2_/MRDRNA2_59584_c0_seq2.p1  ORF type:complete len:134 (-),score=25.14 gnl/MRDRNA2_/MRDRNA2_59584_c0_seq2:276-677(-)